MKSASYKMNGVRDIKDAREASAQHFAAMKQQLRGVRPMVGARRYPRTGAEGSATNVALPAKQRGETDGAYGRRCAAIVKFGGRVGRPECDTPTACHGDVLGWHSLGATDFPITGGAGTIAVNATALSVNSGNAKTFKPREMFFEARDSATDFAVVPGMLVSANISGTEQLVGDDSTSAITSSVFALTNEPLPVSWDGFSTVGSNILKLTFGSFMDSAITSHFFGVFWGDEI